MKDKLRSRLLIGGIAGLVGAMAMTAAMRRLRSRPDPSPPRLMADSGSRPPSAPTAGVAHFAYAAAMGAMIAAMNPDPKKRTGAVAGAALWLAGYMGWIPAMAPPEPAPKPPERRKLTTLGAHLVWGAVTANAMRALKATLMNSRSRSRRPGPPRAKRGEDVFSRRAG